MRRLLLASLVFLPLLVTACDTAGPDDGGGPPPEDEKKAAVRFSPSYA
jgi:hypothetical protein